MITTLNLKSRSRYLICRARGAIALEYVVSLGMSITPVLVMTPGQVAKSLSRFSSSCCCWRGDGPAMVIPFAVDGRRIRLGHYRLVCRFWNRLPGGINDAEMDFELAGGCAGGNEHLADEPGCLMEVGVKPRNFFVGARKGDAV